MAKPINLAVLISGGGSTLQNLIDKISEGTLLAHIKIVISSSPDAYGLKRAKQRGIPATIVQKSGYDTSQTFSDAIVQEIEKYQIDLVILAGFLHLFKIPDSYVGKVMNIHPALIPAFCGKGYYGSRVHKAVIGSGVKISGCTVHFVDNEYDTGPIIIQRVVPVLDEDSPETLAQRVFTAETVAYPEAIRLFAEGRLQIVGRRVNTLKAEPT
ncbi:MAG: phosphoribosylglycinamide formyltransferase [Candidatus Scalindua sp. AMX11]|nr:MAG: phosphoribosylglycinamide formyltransferase [Candidatus Scalindua sp.]NOG85733.1 phosphoribosylglycinamide formyltransferase [Planctomycetota bacterium]RZV73181.1 MAG: phosphoribosylglycinamide formyltransferase [Candidatus Scalindua sp. SCAELEC01]TDE64729.1 MAG: phosphoribosylglycinamide formyltransferase [Candidatus Scalindua sp. AMX11]GJQ58707.1 MAG: phosphoribosylglycinamide formyltransferase [Candidatus Scalindua sp.]